MDLTQMGCEGVHWCHVAQELKGSCQYGNKSSGSVKGGEFLDYMSDK